MNKKKSNTGARRRWSARDKAKLVRRHLRENVSLADLSDETGAAPGQISRWTPAALAGTHKKGFEQPERAHEQWHRTSTLLPAAGGSVEMTGMC